MKSINKKNQGKVNKAVNALIKYNKLDALRDNADNAGEEKLYDKLTRQCVNAWDKFHDYLDLLPKYEQKAIWKADENNSLQS